MTDTEFYVAGETYAKTLLFKDVVNAYFDPVTITATITDSTGTVLSSQSKTNLNNVSVGVYQLSYTLLTNAVLGEYSLNVTSTDSLFTEQQNFYFTVLNSLVGYCGIADVKTLITTDLSDGAIQQIIGYADIDLDDRLEDAVMSAPIKRLCSMRLAAITIAQKQRTEIRAQDGESTELGWNIKEWNLYVSEKVSYAKHVFMPRIQGERWLVSDATAE